MSAWLEHAYDERCRELVSLQTVHDSIIGTAHGLRDERDALRAALKRLHDAVLRHGLIEGDDDRWVQAFSEVMAAMREAQRLIDKVESTA